MSDDDLTRRAIIAAHDAQCSDRHCEYVHMPSLNKREAAIVEAWRADRDDVFGEAEAHALNITERAEKAERAAQTLNGVVEQQARMILAVTGLHDRIDDDGDGDWGAIWDHAFELRPRAEAAEAAIERIRSLVRDWEQAHDWSDGHCHEGYRIPNHDDCDSDCLHCAAASVRWMLDHAEEAADA